MLIDGIAGLPEAPPVVVIGSGPAGLAVATTLRKHRIPVLVVESGGRKANDHVQSLSDAERLAPERHDAMDIAVSRQLGGTSNLWAARCLPFDPIDFTERPGVDAKWPIGADDLTHYWASAVSATRSGEPIFEDQTASAPPTDSDFTTNTLERWANVQAAQNVHKDAIASDAGLEVRTHATLVGIAFNAAGRVAQIEMANSLTGERTRVRPRFLVLAAGGLETTRLLLAAQRTRPDWLGGANGALGRYYMGHVIGEIGDIVFADARLAAAFNYEVRHGSYVRRRIKPSDALQRQHDLLNCAFWPVVPPVADPRHGSAILSSVYLALSVPAFGRLLTAEAIRKRHMPEGAGRYPQHLLNLVTGMPTAARFGARFLIDRYLRPQRMPGFFVLNEANRYGLSYHSEQSPERDSRVWLDAAEDRLGLPSLKIDLRFSERDVGSVVHTHDLLEDWLARNAVGSIDYYGPCEERHEGVMARAAHGTHQIGLTRMGFDRQNAVVDRDLRCFDCDNLFVASTSVLPTSGQANPTLTTVALGIRLADHLAGLIANHDAPVALNAA